MIEEIRSIKIQPIQEKLNKIEQMKSQLYTYEEELSSITEKDSQQRRAELRKKIIDLKSEIIMLQEHDLEHQKERIENSSLMDLDIDFQEAVQLLQDKGIEIVLTEEDKNLLYSKDKSKKDYKNMNDFILVHKTDYIPENSRIKTSKESGVKIKSEIKVGDRYYDYYYQSERDTLHFAVNAEVADHEYGSWHECKYAVLLPFVSIPKEKIGVAAAQDTFSKGGVDLPDNAYILCPKGEKDIIKSMNPNVNIIEYDGANVSGYADALVKGLGYRQETCGKWGWINKENNRIFDDIMEREGFKVGIPHTYSESKVNDDEKHNINKAVEKSKLMREKNFIKCEDDLKKTYFVVEDLKKESFDILVERLQEEGIHLGDESIAFIHNLYKLDMEQYNEQNLINGVPDTEETAELLGKFNQLQKSDSHAYDRGFKTFYIRNITEYCILKEIGKDNLRVGKEQKTIEAEEKNRKILIKKMKDFKIKKDDEGNILDEYENATVDEVTLKRKIIDEKFNEINQKINKNGYMVSDYRLGLIITNLEGEIEKIDHDLKGKEHYHLSRTGYPLLDFKEKEDETVGEYLIRFEKYMECFSKYYNGEKVDENIKFDEDGNIIEVSKEDKLAITNGQILGKEALKEQSDTELKNTVEHVIAQQQKEIENNKENNERGNSKDG